jgi:hypothetical protein
MSLARLWHRQGHGDEARATLTAVYGTYTEGFTTPDLMDAAVLSQELASGEFRRGFFRDSGSSIGRDR